MSEELNHDEISKDIVESRLSGRFLTSKRLGLGPSSCGLAKTGMYDLLGCIIPGLA